MKSFHFRWLGLSLAGLLTAGTAHAQLPMTPKALGMGSSFIGVARGQEALFLNPANLGLSNTPYWSVAFPQIGLGTSMLGPSFGDLPDIINFDDANQLRRDELLGTIPESGFETDLDLRIPVFALQTGHFAVGVSYGALVQQTLGRDLVDLILNGYQEGRTDYSVGNTRGSRATYIDVAAAYGRRFGPLSLGVTGHYMFGRTLSRARMYEPRFDIEAVSVEVDYLEVLARGGRGYSVDFGAALEPVPNLTLTAAVANAYAKMEWSDELNTRSITLTQDDFHSDAKYGILRRFEGSEKALDPTAVPLPVLQLADSLYSEAWFPSTLRAGAAYRIPSTGTQLAAGYQGNLTEGRLSGWWDRMASIGVEQKLPLITARAGYTTNLDSGTLLSGGISFGPIQLAVGKLLIDEEGFERNGWIGTFGLNMRTNTSMP